MNEAKRRRAPLAQAPYRGQPLRSRLRRPIIRPDAPLLAVDEANLAQDTQVMADRRLALREMLVDLADTQRRALLRQQIEHAQPCRIGQRLESLRQCVRLARSQRWRRKDGLTGATGNFLHYGSRFSQLVNI